MISMMWGEKRNTLPLVVGVQTSIATMINMLVPQKDVNYLPEDPALGHITKGDFILPHRDTCSVRLIAVL